MRYTDNVAVDVSDLDSSDILVTGPNGFSQFGTFVTVDTNSDGTPRTGTYRLDAPGLFWDSSDNGTYTVLMQANQVSDTSGNHVSSGPLGTFSVNIFDGGGQVIIIDDGDSGFAGGGFTRFPFQGYEGDCRYSAAGSGNTARWTFSVTPGTYEVAATWWARPNRATNAPYRIFDGTALVGGADVNQRQTPNDFTDHGAAWENLDVVAITGNTLVVELSDTPANGYVIADAIRIQSTR